MHQAIFRLLFAAWACVVAVPIAHAADPPKYDVVISGGRVVDGTGAPWYVADIGINAGKIDRR